MTDPASRPASSPVERPAPEQPSADKPAPKPPLPPAPKAPLPKEIGGPPGPEPTRYGDWQYNGRVTDF